MKKALPVILLILGGILACGVGLIISGLLLIAAFDVLDIETLTAVILPLVIGVHVTGAVFLQRLYQRRWRIGKALFWFCAGLPSALIGMISFAAVLILDKMNYFSGFFAGLGEFLLAFFILIYSGAFFVVLGLVLLMIHTASQRKFVFIYAVCSVILTAGLGFTGLGFTGLGLTLYVWLAAEIIMLAAQTALAVVLSRKTNYTPLKFWLAIALPPVGVCGVGYLLFSLTGSVLWAFGLSLWYALAFAALSGIAILIVNIITRKAARNKENAGNDTEE